MTILTHLRRLVWPMSESGSLRGLEAAGRVRRQPLDDDERAMLADWDRRVAAERLTRVALTRRLDQAGDLAVLAALDTAVPNAPSPGSPGRTHTPRTQQATRSAPNRPSQDPTSHPQQITRAA